MKKKIILNYKEILNSMIFSILFTILIRWMMVEIFIIPTSSMEKTLLRGDLILASKIHYGIRTPKTLLQIPLTHQNIWNTKIKSYLKKVEIKQYRIFSFLKVKKNNQIIFNYPPEIKLPIDLKTFYIKRCIGASGDIIKVDNLNIYINKKIKKNTKKKIQYKYFFKTNNKLSFYFLKKNKISEYIKIENGYILYTTPNTIMKLSNFIKDIIILKNKKTNPFIYPNAKIFKWNENYFGPIKIPKKKKKIKINKKNILIYENIIIYYENNKHVLIKAGGLWINGNKIKKYIFKKDYYFGMGDNMHNSEDSRFWGFIPENHIIGKSILIFLSIKKNKWDRVLKNIN